MSTTAANLYGVMAEFETVDSLVAAAAKVRDAGYRKWDAHSPYPVHGLDEAMGIRRTILPLIVFGAGLTGAGLAVLMQWWMNAVDYPLIISGKPFFSLPANVPIIFETTVLLSAGTAVLAMLALNNLPQWFHPVFRKDRFLKVTDNAFFIVIEAADPRFDPHETPGFLASIGGRNVEPLED